MKDHHALPSAYDPQAVEAGWSARWEDAGLFRADARSPKPKYSIALPPPNVTGELHMGTALSGTPQDIWARYRRMTGYEVLWLPGTDHAAIATQNVIEKQLAEEGTSKEELGREAFNARVDHWYETVGTTIIEQYRELGASLDFSRVRFTMDPAYVRAVRTAFVRYYQKGLIYRGPRIVNWCPQNLSAISDLEVDWQEHTDTLYHIAYDVAGTGRRLEIATVRPETMLADTGIAVHPDDDRYSDLVGRFAVLPLVGRRLPIVADPAVDRHFGTGALKVTPGHDPMDWEIGERHGFSVINALHPDARLNVPELPRYDGLPDLVARERVVADLRAEGRLVATRPYVHQVGHCDRCGAVIQPLVSEQWFLRMRELAQKCVEASSRGEVRWHPERYERTYLDWLGGIRDWCISRQLWLGHRIPVYTCANGHRFASVEEPAACVHCDSSVLIADPDVLDTWFSSALWPFATLGWPDDNEDLRTFYPTSLNATAREIINLWVTRMIFSGLEFMGAVPFKDVAIHCVVQTADGQRMSKSKGNVVDPRVIIGRYGADALRGWAAAVAMSSQDVRFDESRIEGFRRFANKLWNASRLVLMGIGDEPVPTPAPDASLALVDRWLLSRLQAAVKTATEGIESYSFHLAINRLYDFCWHDFCDWYLEAAKPRLRDADPAARAVCLHVLDSLLRLLHPFLPFLTEELWHRLPGERTFLVRTAWPAPDQRFADADAEDAAARLIALVEEIRRERRTAGAPARGGHLAVAPGTDPELAELTAQLAGLELVDELAGAPLELAEGRARIAFPNATKPGRPASDGEAQRLRQEYERSQTKLSDPEFLAKAPAAVVEKERVKAAELKSVLERLAHA
ncbi:MAG: valine--tRNA ligase [Candidatus Dormibacteraeota bacterium]|uniref:Valine--tRNA ligase n=1 Tax=Candidatus Dormiibacter inghamiae TaxID=3127013 RepID=A0A934N721_9BACT|nr:valine--tRNA ligase [Candidatus Dormibacteraeota bacterium]MBJ7607608.1 valine--tRNA ligase [Candidatus Dormibacteraeota bacterium]